MFLIAGVVLVAIDAAIVYRSGRAYLDEVYRDPRGSRSMVQLVTMLFVLIVLGVLALISTIDIDTGNAVQNVVVKLGVVLLVLAAAHAATISILSHLRDRLRGEQLEDELIQGSTNNGVAQNATVNPAPNPVQNTAPAGDEYITRHPAISPPIEEQQNPYPTT
jgi:Tfp pilus assembly major pilin PilA